MMTSPTIHLHDPDGPLPAIPCRDHDYNPESDYEVVAPPAGTERVLLDSVTSEIAGRMLPEMDIGAAVIFFVEPGSLGNDVARYVDGTSSCPVIGIDMEALRSSADLERELHATVAHELGHAYIDGGTYERPDIYDEEAAVEDFASDWVNFRIVGTSLLEAVMEEAEAKATPAA